jgi:subtilisin family serine protease
MAGAIWPVVAQGVNGPRTAAAQPGEFRAGQILVKFKAGMSVASTASVMEQHGATYERTLYGTDVQTWQVPEGSESSAVKKLNAEPAVQYAELNYRIYAHDTVPNDPSLAKQWAHTEVMRSPAGWNITTGSADTIIAILDSGVDEGHPDLAAKLVPGYDFVDNDADPHDLNGHGTHVAGIAAAVTDNGIGVAGMDWQARIMPIRVLDVEGGGFMATLAEGIGWAYTHGAKVLNISSGGPDFSLSVLDAVNAARDAGSMVIASMGNDNNSLPAYPAAYDSVVAVSSTARYDVRASYSNYGNHNDLAAPGGIMTAYQDPNGIYSTMPTYPVYMTTEDHFWTYYDYVHGTSQAAPYVSGLASLIWSLKPSLTVYEVQETIEITAVDLGAPGWDPFYGHGRVDPLAALRVHSIPSAPVLAPIRNPEGGGTYLVDWNDVPNASTYVLQRSTTDFFANPAVVYSGTASEFHVVARPGGTWYYRVLARNDNGDSPWSNVESVGVGPEPPTLFAIHNPGNEDQYQLAWSTSAGAIGYTLEEDEDPSFSSPAVRYQGAALEYGVTGQPGGTWYYRVMADNAVGSSSESNTESTSVDPAALPAPFLNLIDNEDGDDEFLVSWVEVPGATSYRLEESGDVYFHTLREAYTVTVPLFPVTGQPGGTWHYRVRAVGASGKSPWSHQRSVMVPVVIYLPLVAKDYDVLASMGKIDNGDFEDGPTVWTEFSRKGFDLIIDGGFPSGVVPHGGDWAAWLGGGYDEISHVEQRVEVLANNPYLHYWYWVSSVTEPCGQDYALILVNDLTVKLYDLCLTENTGGWREDSVDLSAHVGQLIDLRVYVRTWPDTFSSLFVDDVSFQATAATEQLAAQGLAAPATLEPRTPGEPADIER